MSRPEKQQPASFSELLGTLDRYQEALQLLMLSGWDTGAYSAASMEFDQLSFDAASFPLLGVSWMEVLISRHELMHWLWSNRDQPEISVAGRTAATKHIDALQRLRNLAAQIPKRDR